MERLKDTFVYMGTSMFPTLKAPDLLHIKPYGESKVKKGDVIAFTDPGNNETIAHRVILVKKDIIRTQGDNNNIIDEKDITKENIIGKIVFAERQNRKIRIHGGARGYLQSRIFKTIKSVDKAVSFCLHGIYRLIAENIFLKRMFSRYIPWKIIFFNKTKDKEIQVVIGNWVIGRMLPGHNEFMIKRPFRLFVDETEILNKLIQRHNKIKI